MSVSIRVALVLSLWSLWAALPPGQAPAAAPTVTILPSITERIGTPVRIAEDSLGYFYVSDPRAGGILKFSNAGQYLATISTSKAPQGIAVTPAGDLVVGQGDSVSVLSASGTVRYQLTGHFLMANGITVDGSGNIYVVDSLDNCVQVFSASGVPLNVAHAVPGKPANSFGSGGSGSGQLSRPSAIAFEKVSGQLAVVDTLNSRVQFFTTDGAAVRSIGLPGAGPLHFGSPEGVCFSYGTSGNLMYVVDAFQSNVQVIDLAAGTYLRTIGSYGNGSGRLVVPSDAVFDGMDIRNQRLLVANGSGNLTVFGIDSSIPAQSSGGPVLTIDAVPLATNLTSLLLSGSVTQGAQVAVSVSSSASVETVNYPYAGAWNAVVSGLPVGSTIFTVTASDASGGKSTASTSTTVLASGGKVTPLTVNPLPTLTGTAAQTLSGTVAPGSTVSVNGSSATVSGGNWTFAATLIMGGNSFLITASNPSYSDATQNLNITLDNAPPLITLSMLPNGSVSSSQLLSVSGAVADMSASTLNLRVNGTPLSPVAVINGTFSAGVLLAPGSNAVVISATDAAGNQSAQITRSYQLQPSAPSIVIATPDLAPSADATLSVSGMASPGASVTVNGVGAAADKGRWTSNVALSPGLNTVLACAVQQAASACSKLTVWYDPSLPPLAITSPVHDAAFPGGQVLTVQGTAGPQVTVKATVDGAPVPVTMGSRNSFTIALKPLPLGNHTLGVTALDAFGSVSTSMRGLIVADPAPPQMVITSTSPVQLSVGGGGALAVRDANGAVGNVVVSGASSSIDLTGVAYDAATLNVTALTPAGMSSRNGVLLAPEIAARVGIPTITDALEGLKIAVGLRSPTFSDLLHGDVAPLVGGVSFPDGQIGIDDVLAILKRSVGISW